MEVTVNTHSSLNQYLQTLQSTLTCQFFYSYYVRFYVKFPYFLDLSPGSSLRHVSFWYSVTAWRILPPFLLLSRACAVIFILLTSPDVYTAFWEVPISLCPCIHSPNLSPLAKRTGNLLIWVMQSPFYALSFLCVTSQMWEC